MSGSRIVPCQSFEMQYVLRRFWQRHRSALPHLQSPHEPPSLPRLLQIDSLRTPRIVPLLRQRTGFFRLSDATIFGSNSYKRKDATSGRLISSPSIEQMRSVRCTPTTLLRSRLDPLVLEDRRQQPLQVLTQDLLL